MQETEKLLQKEIDPNNWPAHRSLAEFGDAWIVPNNRNEAQSFMSLERTFLSWVRLSLSSVALGVAIARLIPMATGVKNLPEMATVCGMWFVFLGFMSLFYAGWRYQKVVWHLRRNQYPISNWGVWGLGITVFICAIISLCLVVITYTKF